MTKLVKNLGAQILIGEPGKEDNMIVTIPHKKLIEFTNSEQKKFNFLLQGTQNRGYL